MKTKQSSSPIVRMWDAGRFHLWTSCACRSDQRRVLEMVPPRNLLSHCPGYDTLLIEAIWIIADTALVNGPAGPGVNRDAFAASITAMLAIAGHWPGTVWSRGSRRTHTSVKSLSTTGYAEPEHLSDVIGPRLTGSEVFGAPATWAATS